MLSVRLGVVREAPVGALKTSPLPDCIVTESLPNLPPLLRSVVVGAFSASILTTDG